MLGIKELQDQVRALIADPAKREIAAVLAADVAQLGARAALGEDVAAEFRECKAQALNLAAEQQAKVQSAVIGWLSSNAFRIVSGVFTGAA